MGFFISRNIRGPRDSSRNIDELFQHIPTIVHGMVHGMVDDWVCLRMGQNLRIITRLSGNKHEQDDFCIH